MEVVLLCYVASLFEVHDNVMLQEFGNDFVPMKNVMSDSDKTNHVKIPMNNIITIIVRPPALPPEFINPNPQHLLIKR
jgi:P pilus assembly chaperone PapD